MGNSNSQTSQSEVPFKAVVHNSKTESKRFFDPAHAPSPLTKDLNVRVRVKAAAINPVDYKLPMFIVDKKIVGIDFSGVVSESKSESFKVGDEVFGFGSGCLAEEILCNDQKITLKGNVLSFIQAASLPVAYLTSFQCLRLGKFEKNQKILIIGASGGCGASGVQLARRIGGPDAEIVGVCSSKNSEFVKSLGATRTIHYDETSDLGEKKYFDVVYDAATASGSGEDYTDRALQALKDGKKLVAINGSGGTWFKHLVGIDRFFNLDHQLLLTNQNRPDLDSLVKLLVNDSGDGLSIVPVIDKVYKFDEESVEAAFALLKSRRAKGKLVFDFDLKA